MNKYKYLIRIIICIIFFLMSYTYYYTTGITSSSVYSNDLSTIENMQIYYFFSEDGVGASDFTSCDSDHVKLLFDNLNDQSLETLRIDPGNDAKAYTFHTIEFFQRSISVYRIDINELNDEFDVSSDVLERTIINDGKDIQIISKGNDPFLSLSSNSSILLEMKSSLKIISFMNASIDTLIISLFILTLKIIYKSKKIKWPVFNRKLKAIFSHRLSFQSAVFLILLFISVILYKDYVFRNKIFVFNDIASDNFLQNLPHMIDNSLKLSAYGRIPSFDFSMFLGMPSSGVNLLDSLPSYSKSLDFIFLLGDYQVIKILISGMIFYGYLKKMGRSNSSALIGALGYAFCGHMIVRSTWASYAGDCVVIALLLLGLEDYLKRKKVILFIVAIAFLGFTRSLIYVVLYSGISFVYITFRYSLLNEFHLKEYLKFMLNFLLAYLLGLLIVNQTILDQISSLFSSARVGNVEIRDDSLSLISDIKTIIVSYFRTFSNDFFGNAITYNGSYNFLEDPALYCGLLTLTVIPFSFKGTNKKEKIWYSLALLVCLLYCVFLPFRLLLNGLAKDTFKISSFWITIVFLYLGTLGFDKMNSSADKKYLIYSVLLIFIPSIVMVVIHPSSVNIDAAYLVVVFMSIYLIIIYFILKKELKDPLLLGLLIFVFTIEIYMNSYEDVNIRSSVSQEQIEEYYNPQLMNVVTDLKEQDSSIYRIDYPTESLSTAQATRFYGTRDYIGGAGLSEDMSEFLSAIGSSNTTELGFTRYFYGFTGSNAINTLLGVKYLILSDRAWPFDVVPYGYVKKFDEGQYHIYENENALPLAFTYDEKMSKKQFYELPTSLRKQAMLSYLIVDENLEDVEQEVFNQAKQIEIAKVESQHLKSGEEFTINTLEHESEYLLLKFKISNKATKTGSTIIDVNWNDKENTQTYRYQTTTGSEEIEFTIPNHYQNKISINVNTDAVISDLTISAINSDYFISYEQMVKERKKAVLQISKFEEDILKGSVDLTQDQAIYFSIPYHVNWHLYANGQEIELKKGNLAFLYADLKKGSYDLELKFEKDNDLSKCISMISIIIIFGGIFIKKVHEYRH